MKESINDWSEYLLWAEKNMKDLEKKLLHRNYDLEQIQNHVAAINHSLARTVEWVLNAKQK